MSDEKGMSVMMDKSPCEGPLEHHRVDFFRQAQTLDRVIAELSHAAAVLHSAVPSTRPSPAEFITSNPSLEHAEAKHVAGLMRVNHVGEICAQALYRGQAFGTNDEALQALLLQSGDEEVDHLVWCQERLGELHSRPSLLNPLWYLGAFGLGVIASKAGKKISLGFMAETERQVEQHLEAHLSELPKHDDRTRAVVEQMRDDEVEHRITAEKEGGVTLPWPVRVAMKTMAKVMTTTAYHI